MNILYFFKSYGTYMYSWQLEHIVNELKRHGCYIDIMNPLDYENIYAANEALLATLKKTKYDLFFTCHFQNTIYVETIERIKEMGIPTLLFCPDNLLSPYDHKIVGPHFDLVWLSSKETEYMFKKWGCNTIFQPYAANPYLYKICNTNSEILRVAFVGNPHGSRAFHINQLVNSGVPVTVHTKRSNYTDKDNDTSIIEYAVALRRYLAYPIGRKLLYASILKSFKDTHLNETSEWIQVKDQIPFEKMAEYNSLYALMLSFTDAKYTGFLKKPVPIINLRHFEIPMAGGLQFTTYSDELAGYFEEGKEIVLANSIEEYIDKAKYYLKPENKKIRDSMKANARYRAENEHCWYNRFLHVFEKMNLKFYIER